MEYNQEDREELRELLEECINSNNIYSNSYISFFLDKRFLDRSSIKDFTNILNLISNKNKSCKYEILSIFFSIHLPYYISNIPL